MEKHQKSDLNLISSSRKGQNSEMPTSTNRHRLNPLGRIRSSSRSLDLARRLDGVSQAKAMSVSTVVDSIHSLHIVDGEKREENGTLNAKEKLKIRKEDVCSETKCGNKHMVVTRRRSYCNMKVELADFLSCNGVRVVASDMPPFMQIHAVDCARKAHDSLEKFTSKTLALSLKKEFDGVYGPAWHCIVGTSFGSFVTHSVGGFLYFSMDRKLYVLLFKTTVQRVD